VHLNSLSHSTPPLPLLSQRPRLLAHLPTAIQYTPEDLSADPLNRQKSLNTRNSTCLLIVTSMSPCRGEAPCRPLHRVPDPRYHPLPGAPPPVVIVQLSTSSAAGPTAPPEGDARPTRRQPCPRHAILCCASERCPSTWRTTYVRNVRSLPISHLPLTHTLSPQMRHHSRLDPWDSWSGHDRSFRRPLPVFKPPPRL
jgi:hypothetical protein